ncbi:MAG: glycosyltransferase [Gemmataceae bacterium]|nr:glycosyltransferase [Gemmataceae bacterium]
MRIVALVASPDHVCARYRIVAFRSLLENAGHCFSIQVLPRYWLTRWSLGPAATDADVVIVQRRLLSTWQLRILRRQVRRLVFDFDDAVFLRDSYDRRGLRCEHRQQEFAEMIRAADAVVAGNHWLRDQALRWRRSEGVYVIPTCVNPQLYPLAQQEAERGVVRLAWIGSSSTLQGLARIRPVLETLGQTYPCLRLHLICDQTLALQGLPVVLRPWSQATEARDLADADIGISWLPVDAWSQGKCGLKVLQYMAAGLPVVANSVGVQTDLVKPGITGFHADSPDAWVGAVGELVRDAALRRRLGRACRRVVEHDYHVRHGARLWLDVLRNLQASPPARKSA